MTPRLRSEIKGTVFLSICFVPHEQTHLKESKSCRRREGEWCSFKVRNDTLVGCAKLVCRAEELIQLGNLIFERNPFRRIILFYLRFLHAHFAEDSRKSFNDHAVLISVGHGLRGVLVG